MTKFALTISGVLQRFDDYPSRPADIPHKNVVWCDYVEVKPPFDPAIELLEGPTEDIAGNVYTRTWTKRAKTAQEIDAPKQAEADAEMSRALALVMLDEFNVLRGALKQLAQNNPALDVSGIPSMNDRTVDQLKNAIKAKL